MIEQWRWLLSSQIHVRRGGEGVAATTAGRATDKAMGPFAGNGRGGRNIGRGVDKLVEKVVRNLAMRRYSSGNITFSRGLP